MTSMRERMARAIFNRLREDGDFSNYVSGDDLKDICIDGWFDLHKVVDAALAEMETPSPEMIDAASFVYGDYDDHEDVFVSMIRAIRDGK